MVETSDGGTNGTSANETVKRTAAESSGSNPKLRRVARAYGLIGVMAALIFWAPYVFTGLGSIRLSGPVLGAGIVLLAAFSALRTSEGNPPLVAPILIALLAAGAIASPFLLEPESQYALSVTAAAGGLAVLLSIYALVDGLRLR